MKKLLSKVTAFLLAIAVILEMGNLLHIGMSVKAAENTVVNVYDATTFGEMLKTENVDVVLWQDISYTGTDKVLCNYVDLNGYNLTCSETFTFGSGKRAFRILDSQYNSNSSNKATFSEGINIDDGTLKIESGNISVLRKTAKTDNHGIYGTGNVEFIGGNTTIVGGAGGDGRIGFKGATNMIVDNILGKGGPGSNGNSGSNGIQATNVTVYGGGISVIGGAGGSGGSGGNGAGYVSAGNGAPGGKGGVGGIGGIGIQATNVTVYGGSISVIGGAGGRGGFGGTGGGGNLNNSGLGGGIGGRGGSGGNSGNGGNGIFATDVAVYGGNMVATGGDVGDFAYGGAGGAGGKADGALGSNGKVADSGGAGIHARLTVEAGTVSATGGTWSAGVGGTGNGQGINGSDVNISGGHVTVVAGKNSFGIGGGFDGTKTGTAGKLIVNGGTLILSTVGRGTNAIIPSFRNCTVSGDGALQYEGRYNADGKFTVNVEDINTNPTTFVGYDTVNVSADVQISRSSNITTPKLKGYISFRIDGQEFATAPITDAVSNDSVITAVASSTWVAIEGNHSLSAEYVAGDNDMYVSGGTHVKSIDIPLHTHKWNSEYTIDVQPTCITPGSKSIHCSICDIQKDFVIINATGHNYVDHQCKNCKEFSPLIIFKDYDGTILSREYYYLGDIVIEPNTPSRKADNAYTYTFIGWDKEVTVCKGDAVYTAVYNSTPIEYTVVFKNYDGSELLRNTYRYGDVITVPSDIPQKPTDSKYKYIFAGWDSVVCPCDGDKVYTAIFTTEFVEYTVTFKNYDGSIISTKTYHFGDEVEVPAEPQKASDFTYTYSFAGWDNKITTVTGNMVYTAVYNANYVNYVVTFKNSDGTILIQRNYHYGDKVTAPANPTKMSDKTYTYTFTGWDKTVVNCEGNATYTATYMPNYIDYTVIFKNYDGSILSSNTYHYGDTVIVPNIPTRPDDDEYTYTFAGWDSNVAECDGNKTYTATFNSAKKYVTGDLDGDEKITDKDAIYLLMHSYFPEDYPVNQPLDYNNDGLINDKDAIYLLMHCYFPEDYPITK